MYFVEAMTIYKVMNWDFWLFPNLQSIGDVSSYLSSTTVIRNIKNSLSSSCALADKNKIEIAFILEQKQGDKILLIYLILDVSQSTQEAFLYVKWAVWGEAMLVLMGRCVLE